MFCSLFCVIVYIVSSGVISKEGLSMGSHTLQNGRGVSGFRLIRNSQDSVLRPQDSVRTINLNQRQPCWHQMTAHPPWVCMFS